MCIDITAEDFTTIHHELGHNFYQRAYNEPAVSLPRQRQRRVPRGRRRHDRALGHAGVPREDRPARQGARYVQRHRPAADAGAGQDRVPAVRPPGRPVAVEGLFGRGDARASTTPPGGSCARSTRGSPAPVARGEQDFDPAAKYHVAANVPYTRYFLAAILQFQFHRAPLPHGGLHGPALPLLDLRQQGCRQEVERDALDGPLTARGRRPSRRSTASRSWTPPPSATTSRRCRSGWTSRTRASRSAGDPFSLSHRERVGVREEPLSRGERGLRRVRTSAAGGSAGPRDAARRGRDRRSRHRRCGWARASRGP